MQKLFGTVITYHRWCFIICLGVSLPFLAVLFQIQIDHSPDALVNHRSEAFSRYQTYLERFGSDRVVLIAVATGRPKNDVDSLRFLAQATAELKRIPDVLAVHSVLDMASFSRNQGRLVPRPLVVQTDDEPFINWNLLHSLRRTWPFVSQLISDDGRVFGLLVRLNPLESHHLESPDLMGRLLATVSKAFKSTDCELHITGIPVFMDAIGRYNVLSAVLFLLFAGLIGILVEWYIFKNLFISVIMCAISTVAVLWVIGLSTLMGMALNPVSGMAYGMIIIFTTVTITHVVTHFYDHYNPSDQATHINRNGRIQDIYNRRSALNAAVAAVGRPGLVCTATTAIGFASLIISPVPTIRRFGTIMALGALISFIIVYLLLPFLLLYCRRAVPKRIHHRSSDLLSAGTRILGRLTLIHPKKWVAFGLFVVFFCLAAIPRIRVDTQFLSLFHDTSPQVLDYQWIQKHLGTPDAVHVVLTPDVGYPLNAEKLRAYQRIESRLSGLPGVDAVHSFFRVLETVSAGTLGTMGEAASSFSLYKNSLLFQQMYQSILSDPAARDMLQGVVDLASSSFCISLRPGDLMPHELDILLQEIEASTAELIPKGTGFFITGSLVVWHHQSKKLVEAQIYSLGLALFLISLLLMFQFKSWRLGLLSLIPNLFPLVALFGFMGWWKIPLDNVTIMVAVISIGLSVDDTVHFFSQLNAQLKKQTVVVAVSQAYRLCAKALITTSAVLVFSFCALIWSPFKPTASFGLLAAIAAFSALIADIVFMPALIFGSKHVQGLIKRGFEV